jgi:hypothetical protein
MMQSIPPPIQQPTIHALQPLPLASRATFRSGKSERPEETRLQAALKDSAENPKKILACLQEWLAVNQANHSVTEGNFLALLKDVQNQNNASVHAILATIEKNIGSPLEDNPYGKTLRKQIEDCLTGGKMEANKWLKAFVILQYLPSTIVTIITTVWINKELEKAKKINKKEEKLLNNQEIARQVVGLVIHCVQATASFALVDGIAWAGKKNNVLRKQAEQWVTKTDGWKGWNQFVGKGLNKTADGLQWSWNTLNEGHNKTGLSLAFVMLSNLLSYGIMRPLLVNTTFMGIKDATDTPADLEQETPAKVPPTVCPPATPKLSYVEQLRLSQTTLPALARMGVTYEALGTSNPITWEDVSTDSSTDYPQPLGIIQTQAIL